MIVDGHSYPAEALPYELDPTAPRPDVCLGTLEGRQTPEALVVLFERTIADRGLSVCRNRPFAGSIVPLSYMGDPRVTTLMVETKRSLYLDEAMEV